MPIRKKFNPYDSIPEKSPNGTVLETLPTLDNRTLASPTSLRLDKYYVFLYVNLARLLIQGVVPFVLLTILNYRIYWVIKRRRGLVNRPATSNHNQAKKANETQQAVMLFIIVLLFFICHTPRFVLNLHEFLTLESLRKSIEEVSIYYIIEILIVL